MATKTTVKIPLYLITILLAGWFIIEIFTASTENQPTSTENLSTYSVKQPKIPESLDFAGENVPLHLFDVYESLDLEMTSNTYWHSSSIQILKRAHRYFPVIEPILEEKGIPNDFKYLCVIESSLRNVTSPSGAKGFWQFMKATGKEYGLEINTYVDERYNLEKATYAACEYLQKSYDKFGSWTLAAASYNMGSNGLAKRIKEQEVNNYYDLYLNQETARYVYRILALKIIMQNPQEYGFNIEDKDKYQPMETRIVEIDTTINNLAEFAFKQGVNYKILKQFNPWLINKQLVNNSGKTYRITLPENGVRNCEIPIKYLQNQ